MPAYLLLGICHYARFSTFLLKPDRLVPSTFVYLSLTWLRGPRKTWWGSLVWSDPEAPALELFGPAEATEIIQPEGTDA